MADVLTAWGEPVFVLPEIDAPVTARLSDGTQLIGVRPGTSRGKAQKAWADAARLAGRGGRDGVGLWLHGLSADDAADALLGVEAGLYRYTLRSGEQEEKSTRVVVATDGPAERTAFWQEIGRGRSLARDWVNRPSNAKPPLALAALFREGAPATIAWEQIDQEQLRAMEAGGMLAVGGGSCHPPCMLIGRYRAAGDAPFLALVGKGITFDSGGLSIKPAQGMGNMKADMGGAAAVAAALRTVAELGIAANVMAELPLAENLLDGEAFRPGDVITMLDKTTVEIVSTDVEGRLVLGDALALARERGAARIVDVATLTGANTVVLGGVKASVVSHHREFAEAVKEAGERVGEGLWLLPDDDDFMDMNRSGVADLKNSVGRPAGTITAGLFVSHFAKDTPHAHIDIAGLAYVEKPGASGVGATGFGVAALVSLCQWWADAST
ncbi:MAG: leucyl aminopeptidase family protein [Bacilli bacterium]